MDVIGKMYRTLYLFTNSGGTLGAGGLDNYVNALTFRASVRPNNGSRTGAFADILTPSTHTITTRYSNALWGLLTNSCKINSGHTEGDWYTVQSWIRKDDKRKAFVEISVTLQKTG